jgi:hypothetical protein
MKECEMDWTRSKHEGYKNANRILVGNPEEI